jgi:hypothetical protein
MIQIGLTVYHWGQRPQDRLLADCLGPLACELRQEGLLRRFWFDRFDARGPHVFAVLTSPLDAAPEVRRRAAERVETHLARHPCTEALSQHEIEQRHRECRGRAQSEVDREEGLAANNSYRLFEHAPRGYPFRLSEGVPGEVELWDLLTDQALRSIGHLAAGGGAAAFAARWIAGVDASLRARVPDPAAYWRHHAGTLFLNLDEMLAAGEERVLPWLLARIGARNRQAFAGVWADAAAGSPPEILRLVELATEAPGPRGDWALLREVDHFTLKQVGLPVALHIPLVLFAWERNRLEARPALAAEGVLA